MKKKRKRLMMVTKMMTSCAQMHVWMGLRDAVVDFGTPPAPVAVSEVVVVSQVEEAAEVVVQFVVVITPHYFVQMRWLWLGREGVVAAALLDVL